MKATRLIEELLQDLRAMRAALGASQSRLIRQSISEVLLLVSIGCAGGIALAAWSLRLLVALLPPELLPFFVKIELDGRALTCRGTIKSCCNRLRRCLV
jgi:putative copper export protein